MMPNCTAWELLASTIFQNTIIASFAVATGNVGFRAPVFVAFGAFSALPGWGNGPRQTAGAWALERHAQSLHLFEIFLFTPFHTFSYFFHLFGIFSHLISSSPHEVWRLGAEAGSGRGCVEGRKAALGGAAAERPPRCLSTFEYLWMWFANLCLKYIFFFSICSNPTKLRSNTICSVYGGVLGFSRQELEAQLSQLAGREAEAKARVLEAAWAATAWVSGFRFLSVAHWEAQSYS